MRARRGTLVLQTMIFGICTLLAAPALAGTISFQVSNANVADWSNWAGANTPGSTSWAQDIYGGAASQLANISGTVKLISSSVSDTLKIQVKLKKLPTLPATITDSSGAYLGTLAHSYYITFITRMHRSNGPPGNYMFNITWDRCNWIGCPNAWQVGGLWLDDVLARSEGTIVATKTLKGTLKVWKEGSRTPSLPYLEVVGVLVYGVQEDNQEATLIAASEAPSSEAP